MRGREYERGFRAQFETEAGMVTVEARHYPRQRLPRPSEMAHQMARGGRMAMVEDPVHEWAMRVGNRPPVTVRATPDGRFYTNDIREPRRGLADLAVAWGARIARSSVPRPPAADSARSEAEEGNGLPTP